ncbi:uncharacterized protein B0H18DRAFT_959986 [Fomitopsis serialis]|uniref:uncharacterized protein n=1 Tax=Fomitopsis serialis TaxID=139415 RepID=UPI002008371E|nr:uncharacterized protein B0H18DRAFT_959986 [Neoantrodia serialis]KAH9914204.1 hypothetical protein B0H18DRAFT_959986 [Neoantrodia serialis]
MPSLSFNGDILLLSALYYPSDGLLERSVPVVTTFEGGRNWVDVERIMTRDFQIFSRTIAVRDDQDKLHRFMLFWQTQTHDRHPRALRINEPAKAVVPGHTFRGDLLIMRIGVRRPYTHLTDSGEKAFARAALRRFLDTATHITEMRQANNSDIRTIMPADLDGHFLRVASPRNSGSRYVFEFDNEDVAALMTAYVMLSRPATSALQSDDLQPVMLHAAALNAHSVHHPAAAAPPSQPRRRCPSEARPERRNPPAGGSKHGGLAREDVRQVDIGDARRLSAKRWQDVAFMRSPVSALFACPYPKLTIRGGLSSMADSSPPESDPQVLGVDHLRFTPSTLDGAVSATRRALIVVAATEAKSASSKSRSRGSGTVGGAMPGCEEEKTPYHVLAAPNALAKATLCAKICELQPTPRPPIRRPGLAPVVRFGFDHALMTGRDRNCYDLGYYSQVSGRRTMQDLSHKSAQKNQGLPDIVGLYVDFTATLLDIVGDPTRSPGETLDVAIAPCATEVDLIAKPATKAAVNDPVDYRPAVYEAGSDVSLLIIPGQGPKSQADIDVFLRPLPLIRGPQRDGR